MRPLALLVILAAFSCSSEAALRAKRDGKASTRWISRKGGIDIPITLRSLITCLTPGLNDLIIFGSFFWICLGPRISAEPREITLTKKKGHAYGYNNGVDLRLLEPLNVPLIEDQTEIGHHIGATVADNAVEFGNQGRIFKLWKHNSGGVVEYTPQGVGVDIGHRASIADDRIKLHYTALGLTFGNPQAGIANPPLMPGSPYRAPTNAFLQPRREHKWETADQWYQSQFRNLGDENKTAAQRACPWCFAVPN